MKRRTLWAIGIATAIITTISLHAAVGSRYHQYRGHFHHACWQDQKAVDHNKAAADSTGR